MASGTSTYSAWQPSMVLPNFQPPIAFQPCARAGAVLRAAAAQAGVAVAARRDGAGDDPLALAVALHGRAELLDDADRLVADGQALARPDTRP